MGAMKSLKEYISEAKDPHTKVIAKLEDLNKKISRWAHKWNGNNQPPRLAAWVDEYNDLKQKHRDGAWKIYCDKNKMSHNHNGYDCLA
jgi:hypothetical protein